MLARQVGRKAFATTAARLPLLLRPVSSHGVDALLRSGADIASSEADFSVLVDLRSRNSGFSRGKGTLFDVLTRVSPLVTSPLPWVWK